MEMQQVRYFLALSTTLNFTRAAEECNVSQPALTRSIKQLEDEFGGELIRRERSHSHLTELGRRMLPLLQQCYDAAVTAKSLAKAVQKHEVSLLTIVVSNCVNTTILAPAIKELLQALPGVQLKMSRGTPSAVMEALRSGAAEMAVAGRLDDWERLDRWPLFREPIELAVNSDHRLARRNDPEVALSELAGEHVLSRVECETRDELLNYLPGAGLTDRIEHEVETDHDLIALLEANAGVALLPSTAPSSASVRRFRLADLDLWRTVSVYCVAGRMRSPAASTLVNLLRAADWTALGLSEPL